MRANPLVCHTPRLLNMTLGRIVFTFAYNLLLVVCSLVANVSGYQSKAPQIANQNSSHEYHVLGYQTQAEASGLQPYSQHIEPVYSPNATSESDDNQYTSEEDVSVLHRLCKC